MKAYMQNGVMTRFHERHIMTDSNDKKPARKPLSLGSSGRGSVRQNLSGGRTKAVVVEKKKKVIIRPGQSAALSLIHI